MATKKKSKLTRMSDSPESGGGLTLSDTSTLPEHKITRKELFTTLTERALVEARVKIDELTAEMNKLSIISKEEADEMVKLATQFIENWNSMRFSQSHYQFDPGTPHITNSDVTFQVSVKKENLPQWWKDRQGKIDKFVCQISKLNHRIEQLRSPAAATKIIEEMLKTSENGKALLQLIKNLGIELSK